MNAKLVVAGGKTSVKEIAVASKMIVGRKGDCGLRIMSSLVSRQHCELTCDGERLVVKDLGSSNGTIVNGIKVQSKELGSGDTLTIGPVTFIVQIAGAAASPAKTKRPAGAAVAAGEPVVDDAADLIIEAEEVSAVSSDAAGVGEGPEADFVLTEEEAPADEVDFVVAEEVTGSADTTHDMLLTDVLDAEEPTDMTGSPPPGAPAEESTAQVEEPKQNKGGLLGKLFKKNKSVKTESAASAIPPAPKAPVVAPSSGAAPPKVASALGPKASETEPEKLLAEAEATKAAEPAPSKTDKSAQMGEDELANFLMGLNAEDE